jgi:2-polyprenyl-3-methyl-5-hydroxy-6-metoxy-1,4-benzoquinol methylase
MNSSKSIATTRWFDISPDPNNEQVSRHRQEILNRAWNPRRFENRIDYILEQCRNCAVLDVGCVGHGGNMSRGNWLHARIREVASRCVGVDADKSAVRKVAQLGFEIFCFDLMLGSSVAKRVLGEEHFDIVVAGEVIEHLRDPMTLLEVAFAVLKNNGKLIITTPNPYAPHRVYSGRTRYMWENADHLFYIFPSGIIEMAERTGFQLTDWLTVGWDDRWLQLRRSIKLWARSLFDAAPSRGPIPRPKWIKYVEPLESVSLWNKWKRRTMGETAIYVLQKI